MAGKRRRGRKCTKPEYQKRLNETLNKLSEKIKTSQAQKNATNNKRSEVQKTTPSHGFQEDIVYAVEKEEAQKDFNIIASSSDDDYCSESDHDNDATFVPETEEEDDSEYSESDTESLIKKRFNEEIETACASTSEQGTDNSAIRQRKNNETDFRVKHIEAVTVTSDSDASLDGNPGSKKRKREKEAVTVTSDSDASLDGNPGSKKRKRKRDYCFYCESLVLNFARHVIRNHYVEIEVQRALSAPKKSKLRKDILTNLRKKGNFIINSQKCSFKPMKKVRYSRHEDYLPCTKCLGFYARKQLWKHKKKCDETFSNSKVQTDAQNFLIRNVKVDQKLKNEVFPRMRADKVSLVAKTDPLICSFGSQYLRSHREKHFINVTSRKMRELAKLLIEVKKINPNIGKLIDCLKPQNYDTIVLATKNASNFDSSRDRYNSPTYAMNIATSIKQCCSIALYESCKSEACVDNAKIQADIKTLIDLIQNHWKFDVSSQAADDLNIKKYNKLTIVPLANDLKSLKDHLCKTAARSAATLSETQSLNCVAYDTLVETVFCRVLLLNRRRPGELQRLPLSFYQSFDLKDSENGKYEEFDKVLSTTEKILVNNLKRIVIRGKRGRGVPVLFSNDVQKDINILISQRHKYVDKSNDYMFAKSGGSILSGYKTLGKYAKSCGAKNPEALTSTRLRKHLATLTQLLNMTENDMEQLATFMGHTMSVHKNNYRLPDDIFQTAKISKLLFLMESGKADMYKGRSLDEIDIDLEEEITGNDEQDDEVLDMDIANTSLVGKSYNSVSDEKPAETTIQPIPSCSTSTTFIDPIITKKKRVLVPWTADQKNVVLKFFAKHIKNKKPPKRNECDSLKSQYPDLLRNKDWLKIKVFVQNSYTK